MSVIRVNKNENYSVISNYHLKEKEMSLKAKGLLSIMLSLPDDWNYSIEGLELICKENYTSIKNTLDELKEFGYLSVTKLMPNETESGRIEYVYDIYEQPLKKQDIEKQGVEKQALENLGVEFLALENQRQLNTNIINTNKLNTNNKITTNIYIYLETNFARTISSAEVQKLDEWLLLFDEEIIRYAIDLSCLNNKKTMVYINGILKNWKTCGYKTLQEIKANSVQNNSNNKKLSLSKLSFNEIDKLREEGKIDENGEWIYE